MSSGVGAVGVASTESSRASSLEEDLLSAERDFATGDFLELPGEDLDAWIEGGEFPWPEESPRSARR